jgi:hypothetical protein
VHVILTHCTLAAACCCSLQDLRANARSITSTCRWSRAFVAHWLQSTTNGISWSGASLSKLQPPAVADADAQDTLLRLLQQLHMLLLQVVLPQLDPDVADGLLTTAQFMAEVQRLLPVGFAAQLVSLGEGVCGLLPLPFCCNSHGCMRCEGWSEEESVKSGRCSSCKAAHYCSAGCQKQHWGARHKALCKKLKGQPELVAACLHAA